jgi:hypothetical protein
MLTEPIPEASLEEPGARPAVDVGVGADVEELLVQPGLMEPGAPGVADAGVGANRTEELKDRPVVDMGMNETERRLRGMLKVLLPYLDGLLLNLPERSIREFAGSPIFDTYKEIFAELEPQ